MEWKRHALLIGYLRRGRGLVISGPPGTGKSSVAALIAREVVEAGLDPDARHPESVRWEYVPTMLDELTRGQKLAVEERQQRRSLVVWDDFGVDQLADWQIPQLDRVVEHCYRARRSMIITTNADPSTIMNDPSLARITDRWRQTQLRLDMAGGSRRRPE